MSVPKWLIPVISVLAALSLGVAMAFVGANLATRVVVEQSAKTEQVPVLGPVATGLSANDAARLGSSGTLPVSTVTGQTTIVRPGVSPERTSLQQAVDGVASGHAGADSADTAAPSSSATPAPTPVPSSAPASDGSSPSADDPCAPVDGKYPIGCPTGTLHGRIFADTMPPPLDFSIQPFSEPCGTEPTNLGGSASRGTTELVRVPVLVRPTVPATFTVHFDSFDHQGEEFGDLTDVPTDPTTVASWNAAISGDVPVANLPALTACMSIPAVAAVNNLIMYVTATTADGQTVMHQLVFSSRGTPPVTARRGSDLQQHRLFRRI